jgi:class 3 adenylate cyclase
MQPSLDTLPAFVLRYTCHSKRVADVFGDVEMWEELIVLEYHADAPPVRRHAGHVDSVEGDAARRHWHETGDCEKQRGFAASARAVHRDTLAARHLQRHTAQHVVVVAPSTEVSDREHETPSSMV